MTSFLLDTSIFIQSKNCEYAFDFCPAFWDWLIQQNKAGRVASIDKVYDELKNGEDELSRWVQKHHDDFFKSRESISSACRNQVSDYVDNMENKNDKEKSRFNISADMSLIAYALEHEYVVVTHEKSVDSSSKKIKIPNVCMAVGVRCIDTYKMLSEAGARFVLGQPKEAVPN